MFQDVKLKLHVCSAEIITSWKSGLIILPVLSIEGIMDIEVVNGKDFWTREANNEQAAWRVWQHWWADTLHIATASLVWHIMCYCAVDIRFVYVICNGNAAAADNIPKLLNTWLVVSVFIDAQVFTRKRQISESNRQNDYSLFWTCNDLHWI